MIRIFKRRPLLGIAMLMLGWFAIYTGQTGLARWDAISNGYRAHIVISLLAGSGLITCGLLAFARRWASPGMLRAGSAAAVAAGMSLIVGIATNILPCTSPG
jgi:hypothetical protein